MKEQGKKDTIFPFITIFLIGLMMIITIANYREHLRIMSNLSTTTPVIYTINLTPDQ
jgi:hypothetical protein